MLEDYKWLLNQGVAVAACVFFCWCVLQTGRFFAPMITAFIETVRGGCERLIKAFSDMMHGLHDNSDKQTVLMQSLVDCQQILAKNDEIQNAKLDRIHDVVTNCHLFKGAKDGKAEVVAEVRQG